jgi:transcriptional regulator with XRE-family HTH domain
MNDRQMALGQAVRAQRKQLGLTLDEASKAIGISRSHLNLIELGKATGISRESVEKIEAGLQCGGKLLSLLDASEPDAPTRNDPVQRAQFNQAVLALAASLLLDVDRLTDSQTVDPPLLSDLESLTAELASRQHHARPQVILGPVRAHLRHLLNLDGSSVPADLRPRLARVTAETAAIAGWIAFRGLGDLVTAHAQLALAREHAQQAGDDVLMAQLLAASSSLHSSLDLPRPDADRASPLALSQLRAAQRKAGAGVTPLHGWLAARIAEELALFDEDRKARAALKRAEATLPSCPPRDPGGLFCSWDQTRFIGYTGKTLLLLGDPAATEFLKRALTVTMAPHPRLGLLVDLSIAKVREGNADEAVALLVKAARLAVGQGIDRFARWRLNEGRAPLPATQQRTFDRQLHALALALP